jgi:hypothetical protein
LLNAATYIFEAQNPRFLFHTRISAVLLVFPVVSCHHLPKKNTVKKKKIWFFSVPLTVIARLVIMDYLLRNDLISPHQHGFLLKHSTASQLLECLDKGTLE